MLYVVLTGCCEFDNFNETLVEQVHEWIVVDGYRERRCVTNCWSVAFDCFGDCTGNMDPDLDICFEMCAMEKTDCVETCLF